MLLILSLFATAIKETRKPCCRKESARCHVLSFRYPSAVNCSLELGAVMSSILWRLH